MRIVSHIRHGTIERRKIHNDGVNLHALALHESPTHTDDKKENKRHHIFNVEKP